MTATQPDTVELAELIDSETMDELFEYIEESASRPRRGDLYVGE